MRQGLHNLKFIELYTIAYYPLLLQNSSYLVLIWATVTKMQTTSLRNVFPLSDLCYCDYHHPHHHDMVNMHTSGIPIIPDGMVSTVGSRRDVL